MDRSLTLPAPSLWKNVVASEAVSTHAVHMLESWEGVEFWAGRGSGFIEGKVEQSFTSDVFMGWVISDMAHS